MPVTFVAHQLPVLPVARRWPGRTDGVALVIGSMAPDFAYVLNGSRFEVRAHGLPWLVTFCVPVTVFVAWIVVRVLAPVVPAHLPQLGNFRLQEYRGLATHRFGMVRTPVCAFIGALSQCSTASPTVGAGSPTTSTGTTTSSSKAPGSVVRSPFTESSSTPATSSGLRSASGCSGATDVSVG
jgi:hypothetical protein